MGYLEYFLFFCGLIICLLFFLPDLARRQQCKECKFWFKFVKIKVNYAVSGDKITTTTVKKCRKCGFKQTFKNVEKLRNKG
jgi:RNase P subunit RPR2